jgi:putative membrane protein
MFAVLSIAATALCLMSGATFAQSGANPSVSQIAQIAYPAGLPDIGGAKQALSKSTNKEVHAFVQNMVVDHSAVTKQAPALLKKLKVTPEDNDTSRTLTNGAVDNRADVANLKGAAFNNACVSSELTYHKAVNDALETTLIPSAGSAELKSFRQTGLKVFQGHEQHAEQVASDLL